MKSARSWFRRSIARYFLVACLLLCYLFAGSLSASAQYFEVINNRKKAILPFKFIRNLVVVKLNINGRGPFNFALDSGSGMIIVTDPSLIDSLNILNRRTIIISGFGNGDENEAFIAPRVNIDMGGLRSVDVGAAFFKKDYFGLSNYAGIPIHGLLGFEFFNKLVVRLNFGDSTLTAYRPKNFHLRKNYEKIPITLEGRKPYINIPVAFFDSSLRNCKVIVDLGAGYALSLENGLNKEWPIEKTIDANLGMGLSGVITGEIGRVSKMVLGKFSFTNVLTSFPETTVETPLKIPKDGNLGIEILKKFVTIFDYPNGYIYLKPKGNNFNTPLEHDMSGLEYFAAGKELKQIFISRVEPGSPGDNIGLAKDDELSKVNLKPVYKLTLEELDRLFKSGDGRNLILEVIRNNEKESVVLTLKRRI